jgi:hypothetical protein
MGIRERLFRDSWRGGTFDIGSARGVSTYLFEFIEECGDNKEVAMKDCYIVDHDGGVVTS